MQHEKRAENQVCLSHCYRVLPFQFSINVEPGGGEGWELSLDGWHRPSLSLGCCPGPSTEGGRGATLGSTQIRSADSTPLQEGGDLAIRFQQET